MVTTSHITTASQLWEAGDIGRCELVRGELIMLSLSGFEHGRVVGWLTGLLAAFVEREGVGVVVGPETGFWISRNPDSVRAPDLGYVRRERVPEGGERGFFEGAPDLAVEVLSPSDGASEVMGKVRQWLEAGCAVVWVVDPENHTISIYSADGHADVLDMSDQLTGGDVLPGFEVAVSEVFGETDR